MRIINPELLREFAASRRCEYCRKPTPGGADPHHVFARGMGGGGRLDILPNIAAVCRVCHQLAHTGHISRYDLLVVIAKRERTTTDAIIDVVNLLRLLDKDALPWKVEEAMTQLDLTAQTLARKVMQPSSQNAQIPM